MCCLSHKEIKYSVEFYEDLKQSTVGSSHVQSLGLGVEWPQEQSNSCSNYVRTKLLDLVISICFVRGESHHPPYFTQVSF